MNHAPIDGVTWSQAPEENFTGRVWFGPMAGDYSSGNGVIVLGVQFAPGARTDWHWHPGGQVLHVVSGAGFVANRSGERVAMAAGDTVTIPRDEVHWHGAAPDSPMLHLSITSGGATQWEPEKVTDGDYLPDQPTT